MLAKCANPECSTPLHYLREGKIFRIDFDTVMMPSGGSLRRVEYFWLCGPCSTQLTLHYRSGEGVALQPLDAQSDQDYARAS
jgi:hypothetical protein